MKAELPFTIELDQDAQRVLMTQLGDDGASITCALDKAQISKLMAVLSHGLHILIRLFCKIETEMPFDPSVALQPAQNGVTLAENDAVKDWRVGIKSGIAIPMLTVLSESGRISNHAMSPKTAMMISEALAKEAKKGLEKTEKATFS